MKTGIQEKSLMLESQDSDFRGNGYRDIMQDVDIDRWRITSKAILFRFRKY